MRKHLIYLLVLLMSCLLVGSVAMAGETSQPEIRFYGFIKTDASFDDSKTDNLDAPKFAASEQTTDNEDQFAMTAMNSRLGFKYSSQTAADRKIFGNVEIDFFDTASDNSQKPRMRHAFFELQDPDWSLLAGQTWDVFGPLGPDSVNTNGWLWLSGNIGFRRPQVRFTKHVEIDSHGKITTQFSINRNIGATNGSVNTGENAGYPLFEGRVAYAFPWLEGMTGTIGLAGLYGQEKYNRNDNVTEDSFKVPEHALGIDFLIPLNSQFSTKGELFVGTNYDSLLAGIGGGLNVAKERAINGFGGWAQLSYKMDAAAKFNLGFGFDRADKEDLNTANKFSNQVLYLNHFYTIFDNTQVGVEYAHFFTKYLDREDGSNNRITTSLIYNF